MFLSLKPGAIAARLSAGAALSGPYELLAVRAHSAIRDLALSEDRLHSILPGRFPSGPTAAT